MRPPPRRPRRALLAACALAAAASACGGAGTHTPAAPERVLVAGMSLAPDDVLLRSPVLPLFVGGGSPPPEEPVAGLDAEIAKAFPDQVRGSGHPWQVLVVEVLVPVAGRFALVLEDVGTWPRPDGAPPAPTPLLEEPLDVPAGERVIVAFGLRDRDRAAAAPAGPSLRWTVVRSAPREDDTWAVSSSFGGSKELPASSLPANDEAPHLLETVGASVGSHLAIRRPNLPYVLAAWAWWPASGGRSWSLGRGGEVDFTVDGVKYAPGAWPHPLWRLSLRDR